MNENTQTPNGESETPPTTDGGVVEADGKDCIFCGKETGKHDGGVYVCDECHHHGERAPGYLEEEVDPQMVVEAMEENVARTGGLHTGAAENVRRGFYTRFEQFKGGLHRERMRALTPEQAGEFAAEQDIALADLYPDIDAKYGAATMILADIDGETVAPALVYLPIDRESFTEADCHSRAFLQKLDHVISKDEVYNYSPTNIILTDGDGGEDGASCISCGATDNLERVGGAHICPSCANGDDDGENDDGRTQTGCGCPNDICEHNTSDIERAEMFSDFVDAITQSPKVNEDDLRFLPTRKNGKGPALTSEGLESRETDLTLHTVEEAHTAIRHGAPGFALYFGREDHGTGGLFAVDRDEPEDFPDDDMPDTGVIARSGSGTYPGHYYYTNKGGVSNSAPDIGEVRAWNQYCVVAGSNHPSGGIYHCDKNSGEPATVGQDDIPEALHPASDYQNGGDSEPIELDTPDDLSSARFENDQGMSLEEVREKSDTLDRLLSRLTPGGFGHSDTSRFDYHTASILYWWRFDKQDIASILRKYRNREKIRQRDDYLQRTLHNACGGERMSAGSDGESKPQSILPTETLNALDHDERQRFARRRGVEWPSVDEVRDRLYDTITEKMAMEERTVIRAPTGSGKTYTVSTNEWLQRPGVTGGQPVIHAHATREARDQAAKESRNTHGDCIVLKGRTETCPLAAGDYDPGNSHGHREVTIDGMPVSEYITKWCDLNGAPYSIVHSWVEEHMDSEAPCEEGEGQCESKTTFDGVPRDENGTPAANVIHCTHQFLHVPSMRMQTNIILDEEPDWTAEMTDERFRRSINAYLKWSSAPFDNYHALVTAATEGSVPSGQTTLGLDGHDPTEPRTSIYDTEFVAKTARRADKYTLTAALDREMLANYVLGKDADTEDFEAKDYLDLVGDATDFQLAKAVDMDRLITQALSETPRTSWYREQGNVHMLAPALARAVWNAEEVADGRLAANVFYEPPRLEADAHDDVEGWNREVVSVVLDQDYEPESIKCKPDFSLARSVIGLDARAVEDDPSWRANTYDGITTERILNPTEETLYRRYERGLFTVQVGDATMPATSDKYLDSGQGQKIRTITDHIAREHGDDFQTAITTSAAEGFLQDAMKDAGVEEPETMHYGNVKSRNDFAGESVGYVATSRDPGDKYVMNTIAELGLEAEPETKECPHCDGDGTCHGDCGRDDCHRGTCGLCDSTGEVREHGRGFTGPDAQKAEEVLDSVRSRDVAQSAGRYARDADDPEDTAIVYIQTDVADDSFIDAKAPGVTWTKTDKQREVIECVRDAGVGVTAREVADETGIEKRTVLRALKKGAEKDNIEATPGAGAHGATVFEPRGWLPDEGVADLDTDEEQTATGDVTDTNTWSVVVRYDPTDAEQDVRRGEGSDAQQVSLAAVAPTRPPGE